MYSYGYDSAYVIIIDKNINRQPDPSKLNNDSWANVDSGAVM